MNNVAIRMIMAGVVASFELSQIERMFVLME